MRIHGSQARTYVMTSLDIQGHQYVQLSRSRVFVRLALPDRRSVCGVSLVCGVCHLVAEIICP